MQRQFMDVTLADPEQARMLGMSAGSGPIRLALAPVDVYTPEEIDTYLPTFRPFGGFRNAQILPDNNLVDRDRDFYRIFGKDNVFREIHVETSRTAPVGEADPDSTLGEYNVLPYALGSFIPNETAAQSTFDLRRVAGEFIATKLVLGREIRMWNMLTTNANWNAAQVTTLGAGFQWNGGVNSDPLLDIQTMIEKSDQVVTDIYFGTKAGNAFLRHPLVRDHIRMMMGDSALTPAVMAGAGAQGQGDIDFTIPGLPPFHVAGAKKKNDATGALVSIIGDANVVGLSQPAGGGAEAIQTIKAFRLRGPSGTGWVSREFTVETRGLNGGRMLVAGFSEDIRMIANSAGFLLKGVIQ